MKTARVIGFIGRNALLGGGLLTTLASSTLLTMRVVLAAREVAVPPLVGLAVAQAGAQAARHALLLRIEGRRNDPAIPAERVVAQEPSAGASLKAHRAVRIWVSAGPQRLKVPSLEGQSARTARVSLDQAGVPLARVVEVEDPAPEGTIVVQRPPPGETELSTGGVSLLVSRGPLAASYVMPDLIGRPVEPTIAALRAAGMKVEDVRYRSYPGVASGIVLRQWPLAGHKMNSRTALTLDVSKEES